jgi:hypothetical protein
MSLSYLREDCYKQAVTHIRESRWFESMYTPQGKTWQTRHVPFPRQSTYTQPTLPAVGPHTWQPFVRRRQIWTDPTTLEKKYSRHNPQHVGWPIRGSVPSFSPEPANEAGGISQAPDDDQLLGLPGPYHRHAIGTFNICSWGPTEQSLINTGGGYNLGGAGSPHTHSPTFPTSCLPFPLVISPDLHFHQAPLLKPQFWIFKEPMAAAWSFDHSAIYHSIHLRLTIANDLSLAKGSQG